MAIHLIVADTFGAYQRGDRVTDAAEVAALLAERPHDVRQISVADPVAADEPLPQFVHSAPAEAVAPAIPAQE